MKFNTKFIEITKNRIFILVLFTYLILKLYGLWTGFINNIELEININDL